MITIALFYTNFLQAQDFKMSNYASLGIGIGTYEYGGTGIPIVGNFEHKFSKKISAGLFVGYFQQNFGSEVKNTNYTYLLIGVKGAYHFNELLKITNPGIDIYAGLNLYYRRLRAKYKNIEYPDHDYKSKAADLREGIFIGGRYLVGKNVGVFAEIGSGISPLQLGVTVNF